MVRSIKKITVSIVHYSRSFQHTKALQLIWYLSSILISIIAIVALVVQTANH